MERFRYTVVVDWDAEDEVYVAAVPVFPLSTYGQSREEAVENAKEAIAVTIEGLQSVRQAVPRGDEGKAQLTAPELR